MKRGIIFLIVPLLFIIVAGCSSKVTPPGTTVLVLTAGGDSSIHTKGAFKAWGRDRVYFISTKLKSFSEPMKILCKDDINMAVDVKWLGSFEVTKESIDVIKSKVPAKKAKVEDIENAFELSLDKFYAITIKDIVRSNARKIVSPYITDNIPANREKIEADIKSQVIKRLQALKFPVKTTDVLVSNLDYPDEVKDQRKAIKNAQLEDQKKAALAVARIAQAKRLEEIAMEEGKEAIVRAQTKAAENMIITKSITPAILAMEQWKSIQMMGQSDNNQVFIIPFEALKSSDITDTVIQKSSLDQLSKNLAPKG